MGQGDAATDRLDGNRSWRVETRDGPVLQKLYVERAGAIRGVVRDLLIALSGVKTSARAAERWATERRILEKWRAAGFDVPRVLTDERRDLGGPCVAILEFVPGRPLYDLLVRKDLAAGERASILRRFAAEWGRRHAAAISAQDADLIQEHGSIRHVLVAPDRMTTIDLEQAFLPRKDVRPLVAKEIAGYLRSHWKRTGAEAFARDLDEIVAAYPDPSILRGAADEYLRSGSALRGLVWRIDRAARRLRGGRDRAKYGPLQLLDEVLRRRGA